MDYIGTIFIAVTNIVIGFVWGSIMMRRKIMKHISNAKDRAKMFSDESLETDDLLRATWWDGAYQFAKEVLDEFNTKGK